MSAETTWPTGRELRRLTRAATEFHTGGNVMDLISEVYSVLLSVVISLAVAVGAVQGLNAEFTPGPQRTSVDPTWLALVAALMLVGGLVGLAGRLGPIGMGGGQAAWWLPAPVDRRTLLQPRARVIALLGAAVGAAGGLLIAFLATREPGPALAWVVGIFTLIGVVIVLSVAAGQVRLGNNRARRLRASILIGDVLIALAPVLGLVVVVTQPPAITLPAGAVGIGLVAVLAATAGVLLWRVDTGLDELAGRELRARGAVSAYAAGAVTSMDTRELGRALTVSTAVDQRRGSVAMRWVRGPVSAIVTGDALVLARTPRHAIQIVAAGAFALLAVLAGWTTGVNLVVLLMGAYVAAMATAEGARRAEMAPVLDRHFPYDARDVRRVRVILPTLVMVVWCAVVFGVWGAMHGDAPGWILMGVVCAPTFGAGVIRAAYRKQPDWTKPLVTGPMGPVPPGVLGAFARGPDLVVFCLIPLIIAVIALGPTPLLMTVQLLTSALAVVIATYVGDQKRPDGQAQGAPGRRS